MKKMMQAIQVPSPGAPFVLASLPVPEPSTDEVLIKVEACGICHGDALALEGNYPGLTYPVIPGHEVIGTIVETGSLAASFWRSGQRVGVGWHGGHCGQCASCRRGDFWHCEHVRTTGLSRNGGYAEYLVAPSNVLVEIPAGIPSREGAPLLCAGNTVYAALKKSGAQGGDLVGIVGLGGLGHLAVQIARNLGFRTVALTRGKEKADLAKRLGAHHVIDTGGGEAASKLRNLGGARFLLCTAPNSRLIADLLPGLSRGGKMTVVSFSRGMIEIPHALLLGDAITLQGTAGGHMEEALSFCEMAGILPMVEEFPLSGAPEAFRRMMEAKVHFRAVLTMGGAHA
jgi:D-arabinose 1-dehydrogenase-like Zn-dependent alcohol dehydrogenase